MHARIDSGGESGSIRTVSDIASSSSQYMLGESYRAARSILTLPDTTNRLIGQHGMADIRNNQSVMLRIAQVFVYIPMIIVYCMLSPT